MRHKPTFKPSPAKRPWYRRLTPVAWALIGVGVVVVALSIVAAAMVFGNRHASEPEVWWTPTPTLPPSVWWADQMVEDDQGHLQPPQEVQDDVWEAFIAGLGCWDIADRDTLPEESLEELIRSAAQHLSDSSDVWRVACNGPTSLEEILESRPLIRLVEFGPRNQVICDESPTRCKTAVAVTSVGIISYDDGLCQAGGIDQSPCIRRDMIDRAPRELCVGTLQYEGEGRWRIIHLEAIRLGE